MDRHLIITIPKTVPWATWLSEARHAEETGGALLYRIGSWGITREHLARPCKVFVVHDGAVRGYHQMGNPDDLVVRIHDGFTCETTGRRWPSGQYLARTGAFHPLETPIPMVGFRGVRFCHDFSQPTSLEETRRLFPDALRAPIAGCPDCLGTGFHREWQRFTSRACACIYTTDELLHQLGENAA